MANTKLKQTVMLALKNLTRQKRRNIVLALAIAFGFFVVTMINGLITGMIGNLEEGITQITGGTVLIAGNEKIPSENEDERDLLINIVRDRDYIKSVVEKCNIDYKYCSCYSLSMGQVIFEGRKALCQMYGRDFSESDFLKNLRIVKGSLENLSDPKSLIISQKLADTLNLDIGDEVIYSTTTIYNQKNVDDFKVGLIIKENTFVTSTQIYAQIETVNKLIEIPEGGYSTFTIFLKNKNLQNKVANQIENAIRNDGKEVTSRAEAFKTNPKNPANGIHKQFSDKSQQWQGTKYGVETLGDAIPALMIALSVVNTVSTTILLVILLIVMVGVSNTYKMVFYERIREIGTMKALGMTGKDVQRVFSMEAVFLCLIGAIAGVILAIFALFIVHLIPISSESLALFLDKGHFSFVIPLGSVLEQYILLIILTIYAVKNSAKKASLLSPAEALRTSK